MSDRWEEQRQSLLGAGFYVGKEVKTAWDGFKEFALRDNVLEVAVGLLIAGAFTKLVNSFVADLLLPPISLLPFVGKNLPEKFAVLRRGPNYGEWGGYNTLKQAADDGAVTLAYGNFLEQVITFMGLAWSLYAIVQVYSYLSKDTTIIKHIAPCKYCKKYISAKASRCYLCTSWQDGREDKPADIL
ncbi:hypothetical protein FRB95_010887 [Tulasnella sp. JGI-2019a]|nr:hypothetical protein FRB93_009055 [Tulasnella sp. JGI-2019a]KAG9035649.1 hypothetical protein FRB95_010887 [Tulasnella sp. JGI-2019a]